MTDLRLGARMLAKQPASTLLIGALLALGIGATTVMFSVFDAVLLRALPLPHPDRLVRIVQRRPKLGTVSDFPFAFYEILRDHATTLASVFGQSASEMDFRFTMTKPGPTEQVSVSPVTPEFFTGLGARALYGRTLTADNARAGADLPPAVLSYDFWSRRFNGDPRIVNGGTLDLQRHRFAIVGVMPRGFNGWSVDTSPDVRIQWKDFPVITDFSPDEVGFELAARMKPGVTRAQAQAECLSLWRTAMQSRFRADSRYPPQFVDELMKEGVAVDPLERGVSALRDRYRDALSLLMASSGLLLLIACANIGALLLARAASREREIAVRLAVGATRGRIGRQILVENSILALLGAAGGIVIAFAATPRVANWLPPLRDVRTKLLPFSLDLTVDLRVLLFAVFVSVAALLLFSIGPAMAASRSSLDKVLRGVRSTGSWRLRQALITIQIALCTFLLAIAALFVRTFDHLRSVDPGFDSAHIATFLLDLMGSGITAKDETSLRRQLLTRVRELPGVESAAISAAGIMRGHGMFTIVVFDGQNVNSPDAPIAFVNEVSPGYFDTMGMRLIEGRKLTEADTSLGPTTPVNVVINQTFASRFFRRVDPIGKRFGVRHIVGVVSDSKYRSLREPIPPTFYLVAEESGYGVFMLNVRTRMPPREIFRPVEHVLASIDPSLAFLEETTLSEQVNESMAAEKLEASLATFFGALAALLVGVGTFGLLAQAVAQKNREIGIRMALGARPFHIRELIAGQILTLVIGGVAAGICGALAASSVMRSLVYGISASDPASLIAGAGFVIIVAIAACIGPTRKAIRIDPAESLRVEG